MIIGIPIYQQVDLLDVTAPAEIFARTGAIEDAARFLSTARVWHSSD